MRWRPFGSIVPCVLLLALCGGCASRSAPPRSRPEGVLPPGVARPSPAPSVAPGTWPAASPEHVRPFLSTALSLVGAPYRDGGTGPEGFDCSGFVQYVFARHGVALPRSVREQARTGAPVDFTTVRAGDLLFFSTVGDGPTHVALALGEGRFVHAPSGRGRVRVEALSGGYWPPRLVGIRRVVSEGS